MFEAKTLVKYNIDSIEQFYAKTSPEQNISWPGTLPIRVRLHEHSLLDITGVSISTKDLTKQD